MKNLYLSIIVLIAVFFVASANNSFAQQTGSYDMTLQFKGINRTISFYVPTNYNPDVAYNLMVCLHGMGDNSQHFRDAIIGGLAWNTLIPNTIFACPDGGDDQGRDFYAPAGDEQFIMMTIEYSRQTYNINPERIMLEGFSLGGRSALKFGLDNPDLIYALLLNTPAIQGAWDALNNPAVSLMYKYENARKLRIAISQGGNDAGYINSITKTYEKLLENDAFIYRQIVPGMGHTVASSSYIKMCLNFINNPTPFPFDAELRQIDLPARTCNSISDAGCIIRNMGSETVSELMVNLFINGSKRDTLWKVELLPYQIKELVFKDLPLNEGFNNVYVEIVGINGEINDGNKQNDSLTFNTFMLTSGDPIPFFEGFEEMGYDGNDWLLEESGNFLSWTLDNEIANSGNNSIFAFNTILLFYSRGLTEKLISPVIDLTTQDNPVLSFDLAHNYHRYEPPVASEVLEFADTLQILISTDCGNSFSSLYKKAGKALATTSSPIINALDLQSCIYFPGKDGWRKEVIDLKDYANETTVVFRFDLISGRGGSTNIDNIKVDEFDPSKIKETIASENKFSLYPNPASEATYLGFFTDFPEKTTIKLYDGLANFIKNISAPLANGNNVIKIDTKDLVNGVYYIIINENGRVSIEKLVRN